MTDDEILETYEHELGTRSRRSGRGFWIVAGTMAIAGVLVVVEIFANRPLVNAISRSQHSLRVSHERARRVYADAGTFAGADAAGLRRVGDDLTFRDADEPSRGTDDVSVLASATVWAAAVQARPGACFYLMQPAEGDVRYGVGTACTGAAALSADQDRW